VTGKPRLGTRALRNQDLRDRSIGIETLVKIVDAQSLGRPFQILETRFGKETEGVNCLTLGFQANLGGATITSTFQINGIEAGVHQEIAHTGRDLDDLLVGARHAATTPQLRLGLHVVSNPRIDRSHQVTKRQQ
jgi:hypothetical protein